MELRCDSKLHGVIEGDEVEVACLSGRCGKERGVTVLHKFNIRTGELLSTRLFRQPEKEGDNR